MTGREQEELAGAIVRDAARRYIATRRARIDAFVDRHFTFAGSLALHWHALGWDLVRAPVNLFLAGPALAVKLAGLGASRLGRPELADWLARRRILLQTEVAREIEWRVASELLEIPCRRDGRVFEHDAIAEAILADARTAERIEASSRQHPDSSARLSAAVENYVGSRGAMAEIATGLTATGIGALAVKQATPGLVTLGSALAGMIAHQAAIAAFPLGAGLGAVWYGMFPVDAGPGLLAITMGAVFLSGTILAAFSGIVTDPLQRCLGLHRRRLIRLLREIEDILCAALERNSIMRDHYVARLVDLFDLVALAMRVSHI
jgi:hypothetical protein